jgi:hypothetical protein
MCRVIAWQRISSPRLELPLLCDLTLCAPDVVIGDGNFSAGSVPGDGVYLILRELDGVNRQADRLHRLGPLTPIPALLAVICRNPSPGHP